MAQEAGEEKENAVVLQAGSAFGVEEKLGTAAASFGPQQKAASEGVEVLVEDMGIADGVAADHELAC